MILCLSSEAASTQASPCPEILTPSPPDTQDGDLVAQFFRKLPNNANHVPQKSCRQIHPQQITRRSGAEQFARQHGFMKQDPSTKLISGTGNGARSM
jgi:hypothetical protein